MHVFGLRLADSARRIAATGKPVHWMTPLSLPIVQSMLRAASLVRRLLSLPATLRAVLASQVNFHVRSH